MSDDRECWARLLERISRPVLQALARRRLKPEMPYYSTEAERRSYMYLEALGRTLGGIGPWLECPGPSGDEERQRQELAGLAREALAAATDPGSPDFMNFSEGDNDQPCVDAACLALGLLRAPEQLWRPLDDAVKRNVVEAMRATRRFRPPPGNHLLFAAAIEAFLYMAGQDWDKVRVDYALMQHDQWYLGDGVYGHGPEFSWDYYNSYVIHPFLLEILDTVEGVEPAWDELRGRAIERSQRYAFIQERLISPDGTFPAIGRSLTYRFGAFHLLGHMALRHRLPDGLSPAQVRCALTAVIRQTTGPEMFDENDWLLPGLCGHQPELAEFYVNTGSFYFCLMGLAPLGLPAADEFWTSPPADWTARQVWSGARGVARDRAWE